MTFSYYNICKKSKIKSLFFKKKKLIQHLQLLQNIKISFFTYKCTYFSLNINCNSH